MLRASNVWLGRQVSVLFLLSTCLHGRENVILQRGEILSEV